MGNKILHISWKWRIVERNVVKVLALGVGGGGASKIHTG